MNMFADKYLIKNNRSPLIQELPDPDCGIIIVIPCYCEPDILLTLHSLMECEMPRQTVEVIVLINNSEIASPEIKAYNEKTKSEVENWISLNKKPGIRFFAVGPVELQKKWAGVGLARKSGMDEALSRFNILNKPNGIIVSLDADTLVAKNYLCEIEKEFKNNPEYVGITISFQHQLGGIENKQREGILLYEKYLAYYKDALEFIGFPHAMFTVGSAFAVTADAYVKRGGMTRRQAGEDFYFLQNLALMGKVGELNTTKVFPSARVSNRVPFGTGPIVGKWMDNREDLTLTYNFRAFNDLKKFFDQIETFYKIDKNDFDKLVPDMPEMVQKYILKDNFWEEIDDLNRNCSTLKSFQTRFFHKFTAFKILKYLNYAHEFFYQKQNLIEQIQLLHEAKKSAQ